MRSNWAKVGAFGLGLLASGIGSHVAAGSPSPVAQEPPVRVSRSFFESPVEGLINIQGASVPSAVAWKEQPQPGDHPGCARFEQADGLELCFTLMNDVDSFGLNSREMSASGLGAYVGEKLGQPCPGVDWSLNLVSVSRRPVTGTSKAVTSFTVSYLAQVPSGSGCHASPAEVDLTIKKI